MKLRTLLTGLIAFVILSHAWAGGREAPEYEVLDPPQVTKTGNKIEVVEVFWYGCPHCYSLEPYLEKWLETKPDDVEFRRIPGVLGKNWLPHARAYFTAEILGILDTIHKPLFDAIHNENKNIMDEKGLRDFFVKQGIKKDDFNMVYQSEEVTNRVKEAFIAGQGYNLTGVPTIIINGKYRTSAGMAGSNQKPIETINQLIDQERNTVVK